MTSSKICISERERKSGRTESEQDASTFQRPPIAVNPLRRDENSSKAQDPLLSIYRTPSTQEVHYRNKKTDSTGTKSPSPLLSLSLPLTPSPPSRLPSAHLLPSPSQAQTTLQASQQGSSSPDTSEPTSQRAKVPKRSRFPAGYQARAILVECCAFGQRFLVVVMK